jgi:hypothetical protein
MQSLRDIKRVDFPTCEPAQQQAQLMAKSEELKARS